MVRAGRIPTLANGRINPSDADAALAQNRPRVSSRSGSEDKRGKDPYIVARTANEVMSARLKKLELDRAEGRLLNRDRVELAIENAARIIRDRIRLIPRKVARRVAGLNPLQIEQVLLDAIDESLGDVANQFLTAADTAAEER